MEISVTVIAGISGLMTEVLKNKSWSHAQKYCVNLRTGFQAIKYTLSFHQLSPILAQLPPTNFSLEIKF